VDSKTSGLESSHDFAKSHSISNAAHPFRAFPQGLLQVGEVNRRAQLKHFPFHLTYRMWCRLRAGDAHIRPRMPNVVACNLRIEEDLSSLDYRTVHSVCQTCRLL